MSNRGQPAGLSSVNSAADERSASHAYTDRSKCLPLMIEMPPVISLANNLRKVLFDIIWLTQLPKSSIFSNYLIPFCLIFRHAKPPDFFFDNQIFTQV